MHTLSTNPQRDHEVSHQNKAKFPKVGRVSRPASDVHVGLCTVPPHSASDDRRKATDKRSHLSVHQNLPTSGPLAAPHAVHAPSFEDRAQGHHNYGPD